ncbi:class I SAM-dependent methyltransferase [Bifidobacterium sp.]|uniref:class I SAM-dependent methyltransferase n=1 Tax=Bifidobacterium sp. TaxID=41200 RepID=UPI0025C054C7|nr:methyltransferase [Bifidobacterium sp.]MCI1636144.1 class I SAM-dependent methyltransferase [Bifidobacterium sp.]
MSKGEQKDDGRVTKQDQYFSANPQSEDQRRTLQVTLRGHEVTVTVSNGVFSSGRLDLGTSVLLRHAPQPPTDGTFLDLGCGWGPIALTLALESPDASVHALDINERAVSLTTENAKNNQCSNIQAWSSQELPDELRFDLIWSNPPIRVGKEALHNLLMTFLQRLNPGGQAYLVVQKNLGADSLIPWLYNTLNASRLLSQAPEATPSPNTTPDDLSLWSVEKIASSKGFRIIEVTRPRTADEEATAHNTVMPTLTDYQAQN